MKSKQKSKKAVTKRIKVKKSGALTRHHPNTSHFFSNKTQKSKRKNRQQADVSKGDAKRYKDVL